MVKKEYWYLLFFLAGFVIGFVMGGPILYFSPSLWVWVVLSGVSGALVLAILGFKKGAESPLSSRLSLKT